MRSPQVALALAASLALCCGCGRERADAVHVVGSTSILPFAEMLAEEFERREPGTHVEVQGGGSTHGLLAVANGIAEIGACSRRLHADDPTDHGVGNRIGEIAHQVDHLTGAVTQWRGEAVDHLADLCVHAAHGTRREGSAKQAAEARVLLRALGHQALLLEPAHHRTLGSGHVVLPGASVLRDILRVVEQSLHVVVTGHEPEPERVDEVDGVLLAEPVQDGRRILGGHQIEEEIPVAGVVGCVHAGPRAAWC